MFVRCAFYLFVTENDDEMGVIIMQKKMISTGQQLAKHPVAGQNTQHLS